MVDRAVMGIKGDMNAAYSKEDKKLLLDLRSRGKGLMAISAHCGNWRSAMSSFDFLEGEKTILFHRDAGDVDKLAHEHGNIQQTSKFIDPAGSMGGVMELLATLRNNGIVCAMGDREFGSSKGTVEVMFLGKPIRVPVTMYRLAAFTGTPVIVVYFLYKAPGIFETIIVDHFIVPENGREAANYRDSAERFIKTLEDFCGRYPYQYFNFYDIWG
ncbi:MAG: lysophospholipid acyltransferase family protein [Spirochaetota bacterium]|nr:lysophospholipid acyltransferase family protein [Spirochaetota bacterium]